MQQWSCHGGEERRLDSLGKSREPRSSHLDRICPDSVTAATVETGQRGHLVTKHVGYNFVQNWVAGSGQSLGGKTREGSTLVNLV